jgi:hypothetical protein
MDEPGAHELTELLLAWGNDFTASPSRATHNSSTSQPTRPKVTFGCWIYNDAEFRPQIFADGR